MNHPLKPVRSLALCVDDFGLHTASDADILMLAYQQRISGFSILVQAADANIHATELRNLIHTAPNTSLGLHLNLTERFISKQAHQTQIQPTVYALKSLIIRSQLHCLNRLLIAQAIAQQLDAFETLTQRPPAYIDGHEHVHAFPVIRQLLLEELARRYGAAENTANVLPAVRIPAPVMGQWRGVKSAIIAAVGGYGLRHDLLAKSFTYNTDFAGVYDFTTAVSYAQRMQGWLATISHGGLIMAHPAQASANLYGTAARAMELAYFQSSDWLAALAEFGFRLAPFNSKFNSPLLELTPSNLPAYQ